MTEKPQVKHVKFGLCAILLINFGHSSVIVAVARNLAVLQIMYFFGSSVISVKKNLSTEI